MKLSRILIFLEKKVEKEKSFRFYALEVIEVVSLSITHLLLIVKKIISNMSFHVIELHNKIESQKEE